MRRPAALLVLPGVALALTGCLSQPEEANDNRPPAVPSLPPNIVRTPEPVEDVPLVVEPPGPTRAPEPGQD